ERPVPASLLLVDDGPDFPGPSVRRKDRALITEFLRDAHPYRPAPALRDAEARTDVVPDPVPAVPASRAGEDVKTGLEPGSEPARDLDGLVPGMLGRQDAAFAGLPALEGEVAVQLDHRMTRLDGVVAVDLDFVVVLCTSTPRGAQQG